MYSQKSTTRKRSTSNAHSKSKPLIKKQTADTLYLMQNENQILRLKNQDLTTKLDQLGLQLRQRTQRVAQAQKQCQLLREKINGSIFVRDIELQNQRKIMLDKIALGQQNLQVYMGKIKDARKQVVLEQQRIPNIVSDRHRLEQQLRIVKMENQGSKKTLLTIQQQNQQLRKLNNQLSLKKYTNQPQQKNLSSQIQDRIRYIKSINITEKQLKKQATAKLIVDLIESLFYERKKYSVLNVQRFGLKKSLLRKKMLLIGQIRKGYLNHVKTSVMNKFRQNIKPLQEQQKCIRILQEISKRRQKAKIWRIWRNQTAKAQYSLIRKYQAMNTIQKTCQSLTKSTLIQTFKCLKNPYPSSYHINISTLYGSISKLLTRNLSSFFSSIKSLNNSYQIDQQIQQSATSHSQLLVLSRMFYAWVQMMKQKRMDSLSLKFKVHLSSYTKYFKRFKKIFVIKKRNVLCDMLSITKGKINDVNMKSLCFAALKQELFGNKSQRTVEEHEKVSNTLKQLKEDTQNRQLQDKVIDKQMALEKVNRYLLKKAKQALEIWRKQHRRVYHAERIFSILSFSLQKSINFAFSRIQVRRFQKLKLSIRDKIASCDYSYNYLVQQNTHIKEVLDKKSHQLQKAKFTAILQRLIRKQKQIKHKFFYKFLRNGFKCWKVKKSIEMMDGLLVKKIKMVFLFLLQQNSIQVAREQKINSYIERHQENQVTVLLKNSLIGFRQWTEKCKRIKRALAGVFDRNSQLQSYQAFGKIKDCSQYIKIHEVFKIQEQTQQQIRQKQSIIEQTTQKIEIFTDRVKTNEKTLENLRASQIFKCYKRFSQTRMRTYVKRWKGKVEQDKGAIKFAKFVSEQTEQMLKQRFLAAFQKAILKEKEHHLKQKSQKFEQELVQMNLKHKKEYEKQQAELNKKRQSNEVNQQVIAEYKPKVQQINKAKVDQFRQQWKKSSFLLALQSWRDFSINKRSKAIKTILQKIDKDMLSQPFKRIVQTAGLSYRVNPLVHLLQQIVHRSFVQLIIHQLSAKDQEVREKKISQIKLKLEQIRNDRREIMGYEEFTTDECSRSGWDTLSEKLKRQAVTQWRTFASVRTQNKRKAGALKNWLNAGYQAEFITILLKHRAKLQRQDALITKFEMNTTQRRAKIFMNYLLDIVSKKSSIKRLFLQKFCFHQVYSLQQQFFTQTKNYLRSKQTSQKDHKTYCLQKLLGTFQKKRKDILCQNMNKWRRNMELIVIEKNLMKRVVRNAMNRRVKDLFYAWKLQKEARFMIKTHTQEGQVKKRKMEIQRLKKFLDDYKKEKGLLLENQEGNYVVSPKFQESKEKQLKRQNLLKYKFISRLILSMNGYQAPVKAWNNLQMFAKLRQKCQKAALFVKNRMQKGDLFTSFRIWSDATKQLRKMFDNMERKDLIKLLNRQKDKMEMEYSKKIEVQEKISKQLRRYKVLSYQDKRKERICAQILFREARKVKSYAFDVWRKRVQESKDNDAYELQQKGSNKVMSMEEEVLELERRQRQLYEHNMMLKQAVQQALELADMIKRISDQRDALKRELSESDVTCQNLQQQNEILNNKLILAQKQAMNLLTLSNKGL